jgi:hypothetical protein
MPSVDLCIRRVEKAEKQTKEATQRGAAKLVEPWKYMVQLPYILRV